MKRTMSARRDAAATRLDAARVRFSASQGQEYRSEIAAVIADLEAVVGEEAERADRFELARTYRCLGDAHADLGRSGVAGELDRAQLSYESAERLLAGVEAPVEKAKLDFNYAVTLRELSRGDDMGLLEAAEARFERAARSFEAQHLPDDAAAADGARNLVARQFRAARGYAELAAGKKRIEELLAEVPHARPMRRDQIARELRGLKETAARWSAQVAELAPELAAEAPELAATAAEGPEAAVFRALRARLEADSAAGEVSSERAQYLRDLLKRVEGVAQPAGDDLESLADHLRRLKEFNKEVMDLTPERDKPFPARAGRILDALKRHLQAERGGLSLLPAEEAATAMRLLERLLQVRSGVGGHDVEQETWRLAISVQEHARRNNVQLAAPIFPLAEIHADPRSLFISGGAELASIAAELTRAFGLRSAFDRATHGDAPAERWNQLRSASAAAFDLGVPAGPPLAQVCYELGLALALGKPSVVVVRSGQRLPFDVPFQAVEIEGQGASDVEQVGAALERALSTVIWGRTEGNLGNVAGAGLAWLAQREGDRLRQGSASIALDLARRAADDAVRFRHALENLLGLLGPDAPRVLLPAWPPAYPDVGQRPCLFHVMPFRPRWANATRERARAECDGAGWDYSRGDEVAEQRVLQGIWNGIASASAVLVDLTGATPNVALELGMVHALGRPFRIVARGKRADVTFPSVDKVQIHSYAGGADPRFASEVRALLRSAT